jgi:hypothetical protein
MWLLRVSKNSPERKFINYVIIHSQYLVIEAVLLKFDILNLSRYQLQIIIPPSQSAGWSVPYCMRPKDNGRFSSLAFLDQKNTTSCGYVLGTRWVHSTRFPLRSRRVSNRPSSQLEIYIWHSNSSGASFVVAPIIPMVLIARCFTGM